MKLDIATGKINHKSGAELTFDRGRREINFITTSGEVDSISQDIICEIFESEQLEYFSFESENQLLFISDFGRNLFEFSFTSGTIEIVAVLNRTDLLDGGYDYNYFSELSDSSVLFLYENGILRFSNNSLLLWHSEFEGVYAFPEIKGDYIIYYDLSKTITFNISNGRMTSSS